MARIPRITAKELISLLEKHGFTKVRQSGSHIIYKNSDGIRVTVPFHTGKIVHPKILMTILKDIDLKEI